MFGWNGYIHTPQYFLLLNNPSFKSQFFKKRICLLDFFFKTFENKMMFCLLHIIWAWRIFLLLELILFSRYHSIPAPFSICQSCLVEEWNIRTTPPSNGLRVWKNAINRLLDLWEVEIYLLINPHISSSYIRASTVLVLFYFVLLCGSLSKG